mmetsp:Transcript_32153/g.44587  ORF Transcript_32153/g.44587 Transcript_32153/m.44587 type:complete len:265 (-) Transcript_32153:184-978(-)
MSARPKDKRSTFARPVLKLDKYPEKGLPDEKDLDIFKGKLSFESGVKEILLKYPAIGKGSGLTDKVVVVGDQNVGKTCLVLRYCEDTFWDNYKATIGVDFMWQRYLIQQVGFTLHLWDTAGQEKFRSLSQAYYRGARACIAAFDLGNPESLNNCKHWVDEVRSENQASVKDDDFSVFLVGCKADTYPVVDNSEALKMANDLEAEYFQVSAKTEVGVKELFERVAVVLFGRAIKRAATVMERADGGGSNALKIGQMTPPQESSCC